MSPPVDAGFPSRGAVAFMIGYIYIREEEIKDDKIHKSIQSLKFKPKYE